MADAWEPIVDGELAARARSTIEDIARAIASGQGVRRDPTDLTLFWAYVAGAIDEDWAAEAYDAATAALCERIEVGMPSPALHGGLAGAGWVLAHVSEEGSADAILEIIDGALVGMLDVKRWSRDYDLISGLTGLGVYFLERGERGRAGLARVVDHLVANAEDTPQGTAWFTPPALLPPAQRERWSTGYFNCGLAHGVAGPIALLGRIGDADPRARRLCERALAWLAAQALPGESPRGQFPSAVGRDVPPSGSARTAWCYGDPGVAIASIGAARRLGISDARWLDVARAAANRAPARCGVNDAGLCHGSTGLAHIFHRLYQATREPVFRDAATRWLHAALEQRRADGLGGVAAWTKLQPAADFGFAPAADLVEGATGVALALLAFVQPGEPLWDRVLQCDL